ncbi:GNAT family N-acetyltransferase [Kitasatospora sp. NPDC058965]|uniref:GNAT family N-acetyltransferase n=1 Tax=Kitasatospora sp. NPDC058965 TaxID=3346682 RepID=UPI0036BAF05E
MTSFVSLSNSADWYPQFRQRTVDAYLATGVPPAAAAELADQLLDLTQEWTASAVLDAAGRRVGQVVVGVIDPGGRSMGRIVDLWTEPGQDEHRTAAHAWARAWCERHAASRVAVRLAEPDPEFADYPVRSQLRSKVIGEAARPADGVTARPMTAEEYPHWAAVEQREYAEDIARSGSRTFEDALKQAEQEYRELLPEGLATPDNTILVIESEGVEVGVAWLRHRYLPGVSYLYSVLVHPEHRGRGFGRAAMAVSEQATVAGGGQALMFNVFGGNDVAMNLYTSTGYLVVEESRSLDTAPAAAPAVDADANQPRS